jgi:hypothetical protein
VRKIAAEKATMVITPCPDLVAALDNAARQAGTSPEELATTALFERFVGPLADGRESGNRKPGLHIGAMRTTTDFDSPLGDDFWTGQR